MTPVTIKSADGSTVLTLSERAYYEFTVSITTHAVNLSRRVWDHDRGESLTALFERFARDWRGWEGTSRWETLEGEFAVEATSDKLGHIAIELTLVQVEGREPWRASVRLNLEAAQLDGIAADLKRFFLDAR